MYPQRLGRNGIVGNHACPVAFSLMLLVAYPAGGRAEADIAHVAKAVVEMLEIHHYSQTEFDDGAAGRALELYLEFLDPGHRFFTQTDVEDIRSEFGRELDNYLEMGNVRPATAIHDRFVERLKERVARVKAILGTREFTFDTDRELPLKRDDLSWPKDDAAAEALWIGLIEDELLAERLADRVVKTAAFRAGAAKDKGRNASATQAESSPESRVLKRYERLLQQAGEDKPRDVVTSLLKCVAQCFDSHTEYMSQADVDRYRSSFGFKPLASTGVQLSGGDDAAVVQRIVSGGPADRDGVLRRYDKVMAISQGANGAWVDARYLPLEQLEEMLRGEEGTVVGIRVSSGDAGDLSAVRETHFVRGGEDWVAEGASAELILHSQPGMNPRRLGWINLGTFYTDMVEGTVSATADVARLLTRLKSERIDGLVLDLRGNRGGSLEETIKLTGLFIPAGPVFQAQGWQRKITYRATENERPLYEGPMVVLTDKVSAAASEIVAAALQDYHRAVIVGEESTFGNGTVQTMLPLDNKLPPFSDKSGAGALKVTILKIYRVTGDSFQMRGVTPDVQLPSLGEVMEPGESDKRHPLPHDVVPGRSFVPWNATPVPADQLTRLSEARRLVSPEYQYITEDLRRISERTAANVSSLNEAMRLREIEEGNQRLEKRAKERAERMKEAEESKHGGPTYRLTLDNVDLPNLFRDDTAYRRALDPAKVEALNVLSDWIQIGANPQ